jgi:toxin secretion/phage lysis holin
MRIEVALAILMAVDILTGLIVAGVRGEISSKISKRGMSEKALILIAIAVCHILDNSIDLGTSFGPMTTWFFVVTEAISIFENMKRGGLKLPKVLMDALRTAAPESESTPHADGEPAAAPAHTPAAPDGQTSDDAPAL